MTRDSHPLRNLADALSEDIAAAPAETLAHDAESDPGGDARLVKSFDRIAARAIARSRRRRIVARLGTLLHAWPLSVTWTSAMAGVAGICVVGIVGGMYFLHQDEVRPLARSSPVVLQPESAPKIADRMSSQHAPAPTSPTSYAENRTLASERDAQSDHAAVVQPAPAAAPSVATPAPPPPAPAVAAGVADQPKRVQTVEAPPAPAAPAFMARRPSLARPQARAEDQVAALVAAAEQKRLSPAPVSPASSLAPEPPKAARAPAAVAANQAASQPSFQWPARGRVIAGFGADVGGVPNNGIDLAVPAGTDIRAAEEGEVLYTGNEIKGLGNLVLLRHRDGFITAYAHAKSFAVKTGDNVRRGQVIAKSGQTGTVTAPQLHFEIRKESAPVDPAQYLPPG
jgi:murein DD-endopeptidase MepM/ murein hydrolase activator NlpD